MWETAIYKIRDGGGINNKSANWQPEKDEVSFFQRIVVERSSSHWERIVNIAM